MSELLKRIIVAQIDNVLIEDLGEKGVFLRKKGDSRDLLSQYVVGKNKFKFTLQDICSSRSLDNLIKRGHLKLYDENGNELGNDAGGDAEKSTNLATLKDVYDNIGGNNSSSINDLNDVTVNSPEDGDILIYGQSYDYGIESQWSNINGLDYFTALNFGKSPIRIEVSDSDYVISSDQNLHIVYTSLTREREVTLPPANKVNQTVRVYDESGSCSPENHIDITSSGSDVIECCNNYIIQNKYGVVLFVNNGNGTWNILSSEKYYSAGITDMPLLTDNGDGTVSLERGMCNLYTDEYGFGSIYPFHILPKTLSLTNMSNNYIVVNYNNDSPEYQVITDVSLINETTMIPVYTIYRYNLNLNILNWDTLGIALINKIHQSIVKTQRYRLESGLSLSESGTRNVVVTSGIVWTGAVKHTLTSFNSSTDNLYFVYHSGGVWQDPTLINEYNNTQYDNGTNLQTLSGGRYAVNYIYRSVVDEESECFLVLGNGNYRLLDAQGSLPPTDLPSSITSHCVLVGRIIVEKSQNVAYQIDSIFSAAFALSTSVDHNDLVGLQGGAVDEYYHLTNSEHLGLTTNLQDTIEGLGLDHTTLANIGAHTHDEIDQHIDSVSNPHSTSDANLIVTDVTTNNVGTLKHGFTPKLSGVAGQYLDGNGNWTTPSGIANAYISQSFDLETSINVIHNFGAYPLVQVLVSSSLFIPFSITHNTVNNFTVTFTSPISGIIIATLGSPQLNNFIVTANDYNATNSDYIIEVTGIGKTITLPTALGIEAKIFIIKNKSTGSIFVNTTSSQLIDTQLALELIPLESVSLYSNGTQYNII